MTLPNEVIIIGGGKSIQVEINSELTNKIKDKFVILTNYAFKHFKGTFLAFVDRDFYKPRPDKNGKLPNPDIYEELKSLPFLVGINHNGIEEFKLDNTILLDKAEKEDLTGLFALKLAERIMEKGIIYLLGFDWTRRTGLPERNPNYNPNSDLQIHYYNDVNHRGIGYVGYYENHNPDRLFEKFIKKDIKIFNVSLDSNINCFEKISYVQFFGQLSNKMNNQEELRNYIKEKLTSNSSNII